MFGIFKKKTDRELLIENYKRLMNEFRLLAKVNPTESERKYAEAQMIIQTIDKTNNYRYS